MGTTLRWYPANYVYARLKSLLVEVPLKMLADGWFRVGPGAAGSAERAQASLSSRPAPERERRERKNSSATATPEKENDTA
ncbi:hypothetical protein RRG08_030134 [Elysia crispata]|uniref:Uncharacterized protein n=1 Tax=Elysia crispata TaxID=231223 RepID=A0AAE0ZRJ2_9GAST|nr:hypothetical protein RRG08_030134 [Elysia crispata]